MQIMTIIAGKGGVGKTVTSQTLGHALALEGQRVLLVDMDPQASLSTSWGIHVQGYLNTVYDAMLNPERTGACVQNLRDNLDLLPASSDLAGARNQFQDNPFGMFHRLKGALEFVGERYDYILIDTPPHLDFLSANALTAANQALVVLQTEWLAYNTLGACLRYIQMAQQQNPLRVRGILLTMRDKRVKLSQLVEERARDELSGLGYHVFSTVIPENAALKYAAIKGTSVYEYESTASGAVAYQKLAKEIVDEQDTN